MKLISESNLKCQTVTGEMTGKLAKVVPGACLSVFMAVAIFGSSTVFAEQSIKADERLGGYTLSDESMLGRYGDHNDEWVQTSTVTVNNKKMSAASKRSLPKNDTRLGAYSMEDEAMLGRYGDKDDGY